MPLSKAQVEVLLNPTVEGAMKFWNYRLLGRPRSRNEILAGVHKARVMWPQSTRQMVEESSAWLRARGYRVPDRMVR